MSDSHRRQDTNVRLGDPIELRLAARASYLRIGNEQGPSTYDELAACLGTTMLSALLDGSLRAYWLESDETRSVPGWAWQPIAHFDLIWMFGRIRLDGLLPDGWERWSDALIYVDSLDFGCWLDGVSWCPPDHAPALPSPHDLADRPEPLRYRRPVETPYVTLSEAVSWIAFGVSLDKDRLDSALSYGSIGADNRHKKLGEATKALVNKSAGGSIEFRGKLKTAPLQEMKNTKTQRIDPVDLQDFSRFNILHDGLDFGQGMADYVDDDNFLQTSDPIESYWNVTLDRAALLVQFPGREDRAWAFDKPLPIALHGIGPVMGLSEALSLLATGKPADRVDIFTDRDGKWDLRDGDGNSMPPVPPGHLSPQVLALIDANRALQKALSLKALSGIVAPAVGPPLAIPELYWVHQNPDCIDHVYQGLTEDDPGKSCPVLLSRTFFDAWRATIPPRREPELPRPSQADVVNWCSRWIESGKGNGQDKAWPYFKADPRHAGLSRDDVFRPAWRTAKTKNLTA